MISIFNDDDHRFLQAFRLVDRVVAIVDGQPILASELGKTVILRLLSSS